MHPSGPRVGRADGPPDAGPGAQGPASPALSALLQQLLVEPLGELRYRGTSRDLGWGQIFGGQLLAQALSAATQTVEPERHVHSMQSYFLEAGDVSAPVDYVVDRLREGRNASLRRVTAFQGSRMLHAATVSFQRPATGPRHQVSMTAVQGPNHLASREAVLRALEGQLPPTRLAQLWEAQPLDIREFAPHNEVAPAPRAPFNYSWMRTRGALEAPSAVHAIVLAYASDFNFIGTALYPHGVSWMSPGVRVASLDHALWFHRPPRLDDWMVQVVESPVAEGGRGLAQARFHTADGTLIASAVQEGLLRVGTPSPRLHTAEEPS